MKKKYPYVNLKIRPEIAEEFRKYSRQLGKPQTETLKILLDFFEENRFSLFESLGSNLSTLEKGIMARINTVVAILKDIEKTQTIPTHEMIQLLFTEKPSRKEILVEKKPPLLELNSKTENSLIKITDENYY